MGSFGARSSTSSGGHPWEILEENPEPGDSLLHGLMSVCLSPSLPPGCAAVGLSVHLAVACLGCALGRFTPFVHRKQAPAFAGVAVDIRQSFLG